jgi:hypothetical protein
MPAYLPFTGVSTLEIIFCVFVAENYLVKVLIPLKGVLKRVPTYFPFIGVRICFVWLYQFPSFH